MQSKTFETTVGGKKLVAEFTDLAEQAKLRSIQVSDRVMWRV